MSIDPSVNYQHWDDLGIRNKNEAKFMRKGIGSKYLKHKYALYFKVIFKTN